LEVGIETMATFSNLVLKTYSLIDSVALVGVGMVS